MAQHLKQRVRDYKGDDQDPLHHARLWGDRGKKRRVDEAYKEAVTAKVLGERHLHGSSAAAGLAGVCEAVIRRYDTAWLKTLVQFMWRRTADFESGVLCTAEDAVRIGNPCRETIFCTAQHNGVAPFAFWLPPQV